MGYDREILLLKEEEEEKGEKTKNKERGGWKRARKQRPTPTKIVHCQ